MGPSVWLVGSGLVGLAVASGVCVASMRKNSLVRLKFRLQIHLHRLVVRVSGVDTALTKMDDWSQLSPHVVRVLGQNPGRMTLQGTNVYIIGSGPSRLMIDCGDGNASLQLLLQKVMDHRGIKCITDLLLTHSHPDHIGGVLEFRKQFPKIRIWKFLAPNHQQNASLWVRNDECAALGIHSLQHGQIFETSSPDLIVRAEFAPGHCADHGCFFLVDRKATNGGKNSQNLALFAGDCVLGSGSCVFDSLGDHLSTLRKLADQTPQILYPGHGPVVQQPQDKIEEYIYHRLAREEQILQVLREADASDTKTLSCVDIMWRVYEPTLPFFLRFAAMKAVQHHLSKLLVDERVQMTCTQTAATRSSKKTTEQKLFEWIVMALWPQLLVKYSLVKRFT